MSKYDNLIEMGEFGKKKRVNSKRKGSTFERNIAKILNERFNTKEFARTPGSGAFGTTHKNLPHYFKVAGDLITPEKFRFVLECKTGYDLRLEDLFKPASDLYKFIEQASRDGAVAKKPWLLVYKRDRQKAMVVSLEQFNLKKVVTFGDYHMYLLEEVLSLPEEVFFTEDI